MNKKVILVTGANSGFGWLHVHTLSNAGHVVYAAIRNVNTTNKEKAETLSALENVHVVDIDLGDAASVKSGIAQILEKEGRIDVLVNNAGNFVGGITETFTEEDIEKLFDIHLNATWRTIKEVLPSMRARGDGLIINTSSVLGRFSAPFMAFYNAAKFAVEGLSEGLRYEVRPLGVDVAILQPGAFPTNIFESAQYGSDAHINEAYGDIAQLPEQIGVKMGEYFEAQRPSPQQVADAVLKLIETPKGQRPIRTVVDNLTGTFVEQANRQVEHGYSNFVSTFGLEHLLN